MSTSASIQATKVTFPNQLTSMAGIFFVPPNMDKTKKYPALAVAHPFGGVKEQTAFEIPGATHHRLYDDEAAVGKAVAKLEEFFGRSL